MTETVSLSFESRPFVGGGYQFVVFVVGVIGDSVGRRGSEGYGEGCEGWCEVGLGERGREVRGWYIPTDIADHHKTIIVAECIRLWRRYNLPRVAACLSTMDTAEANFTPGTLHIVCTTHGSPAERRLLRRLIRGRARAIYIRAREINIYGISRPGNRVRPENKLYQNLIT